MSRLIREKRPARSPFAPLLSAEQLAATEKQSKADRKKIVEGLLERRAQVSRWGGLRPKRGVSKNETRIQIAAALFGGAR